MANTTTTNNIIDLDLSATRKKKIRVDKDDSRILELNTSDLSIINRLDEAYPELVKLSEKVKEDFSEDVEGLPENEVLASMSVVLKDVDTRMRELIDFIFDAEVSKVCAPSGTMYDPINGKCRYEHIIEAIIALYEENIYSEMKKTTDKVKSHTSKYTK